MAQSAVLRFLRRRMKAIFWFTAIVFISLVIFGWGANITSRGNKTEMDANLAGKVDEYEITYQNYQQAIQNEFEKAYQEGYEVNEVDQELIRDRSFNSLVNRHLAQEQFKSKKVGELTDALVYESLKRNPPDFVKGLDDFQRNGQFDMQLFQQFLGNPQVDWLPVEMYIRNNLPYDNLRQLINSTIFVTTTEAKLAYIYDNESIQASFIKIDPFQITDVAVDTSQEKIEAYYQEHKDEYKRDALVVINYAKIPFIPTVADSQETKALAETLMVRLDRGETFEDLAYYNSDDPTTKNSGGELGWFGEGQMVPEFEEAAFTADSGDIVGPVLTPFGYHIIKVLDKQEQGDSTYVRAAHILLAVEPGYDVEDSLRGIATQLAEEVEDGESFFEVAEVLGIDSVFQSAPFGKEEAIPGIGFRSRTRAYLFESDVEILEPIPVRYQERPQIDGLTVVEVVKRMEEGIPELADVREDVIADMILDARKEKTLNLAQKAKSMINAGTSLENAAQELGLDYDTTGQFTRLSWVENAGNDPIFKGTAFGLTEKGQISKPFLAEDGTAYIIRLDNYQKPDPEQFGEVAMQIKNNLLRAKRQELYERWFSQLREEADIQDNRYTSELSSQTEEPETEEATQ